MANTFTSLVVPLVIIRVVFFFVFSGVTKQVEAVLRAAVFRGFLTWPLVGTLVLHSCTFILATKNLLSIVGNLRLAQCCLN